MSAAISLERLRYLTEYVCEKLSEAAPDDVFMVVDDAQIAWVGTEQHEVVLLELKAARFEVEE